MSKKAAIRFNLIRQYCFTVIDANIILHHIFDEDEFKPKIDYFIKLNKKQNFVCEILPKTTDEVDKKIFEATNEFSRLLQRCKIHLRKISKESLSNLQINRTTGNFLERAFLDVFAEISRKKCKPQQKITRIRHARIVESATMIKFWENLENSKMNMDEFFKSLKDDFGEFFKKISSKQALLVRDIGATTVDKREISPPSKDLTLLFSKKCGIKNTSDIELLCQAVSRMYDHDRWAVLLTTDYGDIISKNYEIWKRTLLTVCDPLYFLYRMDSKMDLQHLKPRAVAAQYNILFAKFIRSKTPFGAI